MFFNILCNLLIAVYGGLHFLGCLGGLFFAVVFFMYAVRGKWDGNLFWFIPDNWRK